jgi:hypothetical protein
MAVRKDIHRIPKKVFNMKLKVKHRKWRQKLRCEQQVGKVGVQKVIRMRWLLETCTSQQIC